MTSGSSGYLTMRSLVEAASKVTGVPVTVLLGPRRLRKLVILRACIAHTANQERQAAGATRVTRWALPLIAKGLAYKDHTSVMNLIGNWEAYCKIDPKLPELAERIRAEAICPAPEPEPEPAPEPAPEPVSSALGSNQHFDLHDVLSAPPSYYRKRRNDFRADDPEDADSGHAFHARMAKASVRFAAALLDAKKVKI